MQHTTWGASALKPGLAALLADGGVTGSATLAVSAGAAVTAALALPGIAQLVVPRAAADAAVLPGLPPFRRAAGGRGASLSKVRGMAHKDYTVRKKGFGAAGRGPCAGVDGIAFAHVRS
jgi:hypothetical protein